jgi:antitoxin component of MazEF toxin-antitoxin module
MVKTLQKHGNSHALLIEKPLMDAMGITPDTQLQITVSGNSMTISPLNVGIGREKVASSIKKLRPRYREMLKKLAE